MGRQQTSGIGPHLAWAGHLYLEATPKIGEFHRPGTNRNAGTSVPTRFDLTSAVPRRRPGQRQTDAMERQNHYDPGECDRAVSEDGCLAFQATTSGKVAKQLPSMYRKRCSGHRKPCPALSAPERNQDQNEYQTISAHESRQPHEQGPRFVWRPCSRTKVPERNEGIDDSSEHRQVTESTMSPRRQQGRFDLTSCAS